MGISLKNQRRRGRRRSYGRYRPGRRDQGPRNDPFRIAFYLVVIAAAVWVYFSQDTVRAWLLNLQTPLQEQAEEEVAAEASGDESPSEVGESELVAYAEEAYQNGNLADAIGFYREASAIAPGVTDYYVQIARLLIFESAMAYGDQRDVLLEEALEAANTAVLADPFDPAGYAIMGKVYDWQNRPDQAASTILQAFDIDQDYALAHAYYAEALVDLDRWDQALIEAELAIDLAPDNVDVRREYAYVLESLGDYELAAAQYETVLTLHPQLVYVRMALGRAYRSLGRYEEGLDQFFEAQLTEPTNALILFEVGRTYETYLGDPNTALEYYERAVEMDAEYGLPWLRIGTLRYYLADYPGAVVAFERALALDVEHPDLAYQLGLSYAYQTQCSTALRYLERAQNEAEGDERILDAVAAGYEYCAQPTPVPVDVLGTPSGSDSP